MTVLYCSLCALKTALQICFQGEIHMTDVAIHDILAQTESDPAFQALFDLFDYGKFGCRTNIVRKSLV